MSQSTVDDSEPPPTPTTPTHYSNDHSAVTEPDASDAVSRESTSSLTQADVANRIAFRRRRRLSRQQALARGDPFAQSTSPNANSNGGASSSSSTQYNSSTGRISTRSGSRRLSSSSAAFTSDAPVKVCDQLGKIPAAGHSSLQTNMSRAVLQRVPSLPPDIPLIRTRSIFKTVDEYPSDFHGVGTLHHDNYRRNETRLAANLGLQTPDVPRLPSVGLATTSPPSNHVDHSIHVDDLEEDEDLYLAQWLVQNGFGLLKSALLVCRDGKSTGIPCASTGAVTGRLHYLPLCPIASVPGEHRAYRRQLTILPSHRERLERKRDSLALSNLTWPLRALPLELFDLITQHLAREDVKAMRLVNKEFEQKVSRYMFYTSVVPFNTEIYDMIGESTRVNTRMVASADNGKSAVGSNTHISTNIPQDLEPGGLQWKNAADDKDGKMYKGHGIRVFQGFGPHIKRFGMSFEVSEDQLANPPAKKELDDFISYYGTYSWPQDQYARFPNLAGLERTADETSRMKAAFSHLTKVTELALSIDSGLGWLNGPDKSVYARIFQRPSSVFGRTSHIPDRAHSEGEQIWASLQQCLTRLDGYKNDKEINLTYHAIESGLMDIIDGSRVPAYVDTKSWSAIDAGRLLPSSAALKDAKLGALGVSSGPHSAAHSIDKNALCPSKLHKEQTEWLLETEWAQRAFLESYMLAIMDNPAVFQKVTALNIAKVSSRYLPLLSRETFWDALPNLEDVTLHVRPDWRTVEKDSAGRAITMPKNPSEALRRLSQPVVLGQISPRESIKKLNLGWSGGGEHAEGIFARNNHLLPAPICLPGITALHTKAATVALPYVEHLTLTNCWIGPRALQGFVRSHADKALSKLTLNSVSLTADPVRPSTVTTQAMQAQIVQYVNAHQGLGTPAQQAAVAAPTDAQTLNLPPWATLQNFQNHVQVIQNMLNANVPPADNNEDDQPHSNAADAPPAAPLPHTNAHTPHHSPPNPPSTPHWAERHRIGSWPRVLDIISPGPKLKDYLPPTESSLWNSAGPSQNPEQSGLRTVELKSCGYATLRYGPFDQSAIHSPSPTTLSPWFFARQSALKPAMLEADNDRFIAQIVQYMPDREQNCLHLAWGLRMGWDDLEAAEEPRYDGKLAGGTGRVSGVIQEGAEEDD